MLVLLNLLTKCLARQQVADDAAHGTAYDAAREAAQGVAFKVAGIDLGTTYSSVSVFIGDKASPNGGAISLLETVGGSYSSPSCLASMPITLDDGTKTYRTVTGHAAFQANKSMPDPNNYLYVFKKLMGYSMSEFNSDKVLKAMKSRVAYQIAPGQNNSINMLVTPEPGKTIGFTPSEASVAILVDLLKLVKEKHGSISHLVVTAPAYFHQNQVDATLEAARLAYKVTYNESGDYQDCKVMTLIEPTSAAYAYALENSLKLKDTRMLVFDFGGGTLDISLLDYEAGTGDDSALLAKEYTGDNFLGGQDINDALYPYFVSELKKQVKSYVYEPKADLRLRLFIEKFKVELCDAVNLKLSENPGADVDNITHESEFTVNNQDIHTFTMTNKTFNYVIKPVVDRVMKYFSSTNEDGIFTKCKKIYGGMNPKDIVNKILFVGGSSQIPIFRTLLTEIVGKDKIILPRDVETLVAKGAGYYAASKAGFLEDTKSDLFLMDVVPLSIGIRVNDDKFEPLIAKGSSVPAQVTKTFTTSHDNQTKVKIATAHGERYEFSQNKLLGEFELTLQEKKPRGIPQIEVTMSIDSERVITVTAVDKDTNVEAFITITKEVSSISKEMEAKMLEDAKNFARFDEELRMRHEEIKKIEDAMFSAREYAKHMDEAGKTEMEKICVRIGSWLQEFKANVTMEELQTKMAEMDEATKEVITSFRMRQKDQAAQGADKQTPPPGASEAEQADAGRDL